VIFGTFLKKHTILMINHLMLVQSRGLQWSLKKSLTLQSTVAFIVFSIWKIALAKVCSQKLYLF